MKQFNIIKFFLVTGAVLLSQLLQAQLSNFGNLYIHPGTNLSVKGSVSNNGAATDLLNSGTLQLSGDFTNNGNDLNTAGSGTVIFNGAGRQNISGTKATTFYNLAQTNPDSLVITNNQVISNDLALTAGNFFLNNNILTINGGTSYTTGALSSTDKSGLILSGSTIKKLQFNAGSNTIKTLLVNTSATQVTLDDSLKIAGSTLGELTVNGVLNSNGFLTLKSDSAGTSRVAPSSGTVTGKVVVERYFPAQRSWRLITAPLTNTGSIYSNWQNNGVYATGKDMLVTGPSPSAGNGLDASQQNNYSMQWWNANTQSLVGVGNTKDSTLSSNRSISADNKGYFVFVRGDRNPANTSASKANATTLSSTGNLQIGSQIFQANGNAGKYTLIGNPYASPVDFNQLGRQNLVKRFYVWDPSLNEVGAYVMLDDLNNDGTFAKSIAGSAQDKNIQSSQAFYVETIATVPASLSFNESFKTAVNNSLLFRPADAREDDIIRTSLFIINTDGSKKIADENFAEFNDKYSDGISYEDALKFGNVNESFSLVRNGVRLCAERRTTVTKDDTLFFKFLKTRQMKYSFTIAASVNSNGTLQAFLEDAYLNTSTPVDLNGTNNYDFIINTDAASANADRFRIVFKKIIAVLPVTFINISAITANRVNTVKWTVAGEINITSYTIERSADGTNFSDAGTIAATGNLNYSWNENANIPTVYYRVRGNENGGRKIYTKIVKLTLPAEVTSVIVYPNPVTNNNVHLRIKNKPEGKYTFQLINTKGQLLHQSTFYYTGEIDKQVNLPSYISSGHYSLLLTEPSGLQTRIAVEIMK